MVAEIPQNPPIEIAKQGEIWVVEEYQQGKRSGTTFSTHDSQMEALRAAKSRMEEQTHPCVVRWESVDSVSNIYWNPLYEVAEVRRDELVDTWAVVPQESVCPISLHDSWEEAFEAGKDAQREYNFKYLRAYDRLGENYDEREHRFLRYDITQSGVTFDIDTVRPSPEQPEAVEEKAEEDDIAVTQPATPGMLGVSIPDVTRVEFVDTDGILHRYATPWGDGTNAEIITVGRKYAGAEGVRDAFTKHLAPWEHSVGSPHIASIYEQGEEPTPWVAYRSGEHALGDIAFELPISDRIAFIESIAKAITAVTKRDAVVCGVRPPNLRARSVDGEWRVAVAVWGIEWGVSGAADREHVTPFTAPEQLRGELTETTVLYQLGAVAYWLLCESPPVEGDGLADTIQFGEIRPPETVDGVSNSIIPVLSKALATRPAERYANVDRFYRDLTDRL